MAPKKKDVVDPSMPQVHNPAQSILAKFAKDYGKEASCLMSEISIKVSCLSSGDPSIDKLLRGGLPIGKITELAGVEGTGKTSLALQWCRMAQEANPDKYVAYIDAENSLDNDFAAEKYGVDLSKFVYIPQTASVCAEDLLDMLDQIAHDPNCALVVLDSVGSLMTLQNRDKSHREGQRDSLPALLQRTVKKVGYSRPPGLCPVLLLNQLRVSQNVAPGGDMYYSCGGMSMKHAPHLRLRIVRLGVLKETKDGPAIGFDAVLKVLKGRTVIPRSMAKFSIDYTIGIDSVRSSIDLAITQGVVQQRGMMFDLFGESYKGKAALFAALREDKQRYLDLLDNLNVELDSESREDSE